MPVDVSRRCRAVVGVLWHLAKHALLQQLLVWVTRQPGYVPLHPCVRGPHVMDLWHLNEPTDAGEPALRVAVAPYFVHACCDFAWEEKGAFV